MLPSIHDLKAQNRAPKNELPEADMPEVAVPEVPDTAAAGAAVVPSTLERAVNDATKNDLSSAVKVPMVRMPNAASEGQTVRELAETGTQEGQEKKKDNHKIRDCKQHR